jgi:hypothetical protein
MSAADARFTPPASRVELATVVLLVWAIFVAIPLSLGGIGLGWDALNHQVYLGWIANAPRFDRDFLAANYQSFQYPYLYWPLYQLMQHQVPGRWAGAVLASLIVTVVPALWLLARSLVREQTWYGLAMRILAVALAFVSAVVLSHLDSTGNDLLAAIPLVWAVALGLLPFDSSRPAWATPSRLAVLSGALAGMAVAFKLSNGPLAILLPLLWLGGGGHRPGEKLIAVVLGSLATVASFALCYGYWGWQLWRLYGNPVHPFYPGITAPLRLLLGQP